MDAATLAASPFLNAVAWSVLLLLVHVMLQGLSATQEMGLHWNAGPRDEGGPAGRLSGRTARASANFRETYPAFVGLALALAIAGDPGGWGMTAVWVWFVARIVYLPLYLAGVPYVRSMAWFVSFLALVVMAFGMIL